MPAFECFLQVLSISPPALVIVWAIWCLLTLITCMFAFSFIYFLIGKLRQRKSRKKSNSKSLWSKNVFPILMFITDICIACYVTISLPSSIFFIHFWRGEDIAPSIDYDTDLNKCNYNGYNFYTTFYWIFALPNFFCYDCSYISILLTYFYRLFKLFHGSMYQISKIKAITLKILMTIFIVISISRQIFIVVAFSNHQTVIISVILWHAFIFMHLIISLYLVWNLNKQAKMLKLETLQVQVRSNLGKNEAQNESSQVNGKAEKIARLFARLVLLAYVCVVSSLILIVASVLVYGILTTVFDTKQGYFFDIFLWTTVFVDNLVNVACISLQYEDCGYFDKIYDACCRPCERSLALTNNSDAPHKVSNTSET